MNNNELRTTVAELQDLYSQVEAIKAEITARETQIKQEMDNREVEVIDLGTAIIRFTSILSNKFDTKRFKTDFADIYNMFLKQVPSRRFTIA